MLCISHSELFSNFSRILPIFCFKNVNLSRPPCNFLNFKFSNIGKFNVNNFCYFKGGVVNPVPTAELDPDPHPDLQNILDFIETIL